MDGGNKILMTVSFAYVNIVREPEISKWNTINRIAQNICFITIWRIIALCIIFQYLTYADLLVTIGSAHTSICLSECSD